MTDLERLIAWWVDQSDVKAQDWTDRQCQQVASTIKFLKELKELKGE